MDNLLQSKLLSIKLDLLGLNMFFEAFYAPRIGVKKTGNRMCSLLVAQLVSKVLDNILHLNNGCTCKCLKQIAN